MKRSVDVLSKRLLAGWPPGFAGTATVLPFRSKRLHWGLAALMALPLLMAQTPASLESRVAAYWDALAKRDKASAIELVATERRNAFIQRREPQIQSWKLDRIEKRSDSEAVVTVELMRSIPGVPGFHKTRVVEAWTLEDGQWRAVVAAVKPAALLEQFQTGADSVHEPAAGQLNVVPDTLRVHFLSRAQTGGVRLANGLDDAVEIERLEFDKSLFQVTKSATRVEPLSYGSFVLRYIGSSISKDLHSQLRIVARVRNEERVFEVPIVYNYLSPGARALFGLTPESAEKLKRDDKLTPVLQRPPS